MTGFSLKEGAVPRLGRAMVLTSVSVHGLVKANAALAAVDSLKKGVALHIHNLP